MRRRIGTGFMILGTALILAALSLFLWNRWEDSRAGVSVDAVLPQLLEQIETEEEAPADPYGTEMPEAEVDGYEYIGYLSIPALGLELPVMSSWSYPQLRIAPCRYYGSVETEDLVIAAHNYSRHFGNIKTLAPGDEVYFTEMDGTVTAYEVAETDTLNPTAVEEMTDGGWSLTLFTCTYGGQSRVTVRCSLAEE